MTGKKKPATKARGARARGTTNAPRRANPRTPQMAQPRRVRAPAAANTSSSQRGRMSTHYRESERLVTLTGTEAFGIIQSVSCNPGLAASFPWLAGHAHLYDRYRIHKLHYRYKNLVGTSTNGNILLSFDYDAKHAAPKNAIEMTQLTKWVDGAPWRIIDFHVPTTGQIYYIRNGEITAPYDIKTYDMGTLHVAGEGFAASTTAGYLEVIYHIELIDKAPSSETLTPIVPGMPVTPEACSTSAGSATDICQPNALITCTAVEAGLLQGLVVEQDRGTSVTVSAGGLLLPAGVWTVKTLNTPPSSLTFTTTSSAGDEAIGTNDPEVFRLHSDIDFGAGTVFLQRRADFVNREPFPDVSRLVYADWTACRITGSNSRFYAANSVHLPIIIPLNAIPVTVALSTRKYIFTSSAITTQLACFTLPVGTYNVSATGTIGGISASLLLNTNTDVYTPIGEPIVVTSASHTWCPVSYTADATNTRKAGSITITIGTSVSRRKVQSLEQRLCALLRQDEPEFESAEDAANHAYHVRVLNDFLDRDAVRVCGRSPSGSGGPDQCSGETSITDENQSTSDGGTVEDKWTPTKSRPTEFPGVVEPTTTITGSSRLQPTEAVKARYFAATGKCWPGC